MSDQPTPDPDPDPDDPTVDDSQLPAAERRKIVDTAKALVDGSLRMDSDDFQALPPRVRRRAWVRYQAAREDRENVRERNARQRVAEENHYADVAVAAHAERLREREERERERRPRVATETATVPGSGAAFEMAVQHVTQHDESPGE